MHRNSHADTGNKDIRRFGMVACVFFGALCGVGLWTKKPLATGFFGTLFILGLGFILMPGRLSPVYGVWLKIADFVGKTINVFVLTLAYYLVITPAALIKRLFGGRPLPTKPDKEASSYWVIRTEPAQPRERFIKRY